MLLTLVKLSAWPTENTQRKRPQRALRAWERGAPRAGLGRKKATHTGDRKSGQVFSSPTTPSARITCA